MKWSEAPDRVRCALVSFESLARSTAAGNHIQAVCRGLEPRSDVVTCGSYSRSKIARYLQTYSNYTKARQRDVVYVRYHPAAVPLILICRMRKQSVVLELNGPADDVAGSHRWVQPVLAVFRGCMSLSVRLADRVVVVTPGLAEYARRFGCTSPIAVIPAGYDERVFGSADGGRSSVSVPDRYVAFVGSNAKWQGVEHLVAAAEHSDWPRSVKLVLVGDFESLDTRGLDRAHPERLVRLGRLDPREVAVVYRHAVASLVVKEPGTLYERLIGLAPIKVFETMACGTPCIASDVKGLRELVAGHGFGLTVQPGDPTEIAQAVRRYAEDDELRSHHSDAARAAAPAFSWSHLGTQTADFVLGPLSA